MLRSYLSLGMQGIVCHASINLLACLPIGLSIPIHVGAICRSCQLKAWALPNLIPAGGPLPSNPRNLHLPSISQTTASDLRQAILEINACKLQVNPVYAL